MNMKNIHKNKYSAQSKQNMLFKKLYIQVMQYFPGKECVIKEPNSPFAHLLKSGYYDTKYYNIQIEKDNFACIMIMHVMFIKQY